MSTERPEGASQVGGSQAPASAQDPRGAQALPSPPAPGDPILVIRDVTKVYQLGDTEVHALRGVSLTIHRGEFVAIMGASGSGKSTLMNILGCLDHPTSGDYLLEGINVARLDEPALARIRGRRIGFVFQSFNLLPRTKAIENVELPLTYRGMPGSERKKAVMEALEKVGMSHRVKHYPSQLSGGQQQRVAVARALAGSPSVLLADEPTGNLDSANGEAVMDLLRGLHRNGATIVMVTHDPRYAKFADRTIHMFDGRVVEETTAAA